MKRVLIPAITLIVAAVLCQAAEHVTTPQSAEDVLMGYMSAVQQEIKKNLNSMNQDGILQKFDDLGKQHLLANKNVLHDKAMKDYLKLDELNHLDVTKLPRIHWKHNDDYKGVDMPGEDDKVGQMICMFREDGYGIPPFDRHMFATKWWDPFVAASIIRELSFRRTLPDEEAQKRKFLEQFATPRVYRLSSDPANPSIAFYDGSEVFIVDLQYSEKIGIYALAGIRWVKVTGK